MAPVFSEPIAGIIFDRCASCHRPDYPGTFPLTSYEAVAIHAERIKQVTEDRSMPPWPADPTFRHFDDERVLSQREIDVIGVWVESGAPPGDLEALPPVPPRSAESRLGVPDLVVEMPEPFPISGDNRDQFVSVRIPFETPRDTFVRAIEFVPDNRALVHHMNGHLITFDPRKKLDIYSGTTFVRDAVHNPVVLESLDLRNDDGSFAPLWLNLVNYLPGLSSPIYPEGIGGLFPLSTRNVLLINTIHYGPSPRDTFDLSRFNIWYGPQPRRIVREFILGTLGVAPVVPELAIPPDTVLDFRIEYRVPIDISVLTVNPHMHRLGKRIAAYAVTPERDTIPIVRINRWNFRWQYAYTFRNLLKVPALSMIVVEATYDNTSENPDNPFDPPRLVTDREASMKSSDEMLQLIFSWMPYEPGDGGISLEIGVR